MSRSRVRSDQGAENIHVARWIIANVGGNRGSMLTGSLVHNHRIDTCEGMSTMLWFDPTETFSII